MDFVISEARKYGVHLILTLSNYFDSFGGRPQYIKWARDEGRSLSSDDDFYTDDLVKTYYKNHVKVLITESIHTINSCSVTIHHALVDHTSFEWFRPF